MEKFDYKLLDRERSCLIIIDAQTGFFNRLPLSKKNNLLENISSTVRIANYFNIPTITTVESADVFQGTDEKITNSISDKLQEFDKVIFGLAYQSDILEAVRETGRDMPVLVGMETDVCIAHSAIGLAQEGYYPFVIDDACGAPSGFHDTGLRRLGNAGINVITVREMFYDWVSDVSTLKKLRKDLGDIEQAPGFSIHE